MRFAQSTLKTELDQFYTPITIVDFIVTLLDIKITILINISLEILIVLDKVSFE